MSDTIAVNKEQQLTKDASSDNLQEQQLIENASSNNFQEQHLTKTASANNLQEQHLTKNASANNLQEQQLTKNASANNLQEQQLTKNASANNLQEQQLTKNASANNLQTRRYSREDLISFSKLPESLRRPSCLDHLYDCENGKWDPERWYTANFEPAHENSSLTFTNGKDGRKVTDRDYKKRFSPNHPVERLKSERDGIVLSPQRRSFVTGCHVKALPHAYTRHLSLPDREESKGDWDQRGENERDRVYTSVYYSRERPLRHADSGRIQFEKGNSIHDSVDNRSYSRESEYDQQFAHSRDKERERKRDRDLRNESARERRGDRIDSFPSVDDKSYNARDWRDREFQDKGFNRNARRRNNREEKEPEWYTGGPTSQTDVIELRGFEHEEDHGHQVVDGRKPSQRKDSKSSTTLSGQSADSARKGASKAGSTVSRKVSPDHLGEPRSSQNEQKDKKNIPNHKQQEHQIPMMPQHNLRAAASNKLFDFEEVLSAILPSDENGVRHGSRFSRFFPEPNGNMMESDASSLEDMLLSGDGSHSNSIVPSPAPNTGPMGSMQHSYHCMPPHFHGQTEPPTRAQSFPKPHHLVSVPDSAGDNNGHPPMLPSLTALFNSAARGGPNSYRWNGHLDGSLETPDTSLYTNSTASSNSFSAQDAETQLKAMLFGGSRGSSGCVSPAQLPLGVHQRAKTLAELEADMHQDSPTTSHSRKPGGPSSSADNGDITAFSKLLIMMNAASEANQNMAQAQAEWASHAGSGMLPSHNEFHLAVMRNKEKQMQMLQQSLHHSQRPVPGMPPLPQQAFHPHMGHNGQSLPGQSHQPAQAMNLQQYQQQMQHLDGLTAPRQFADPINQQSCSVGTPQAMSTPQPGHKMRAPAGGLSADPILSLIQQHPRMISVSPTPHRGPIQTPQQSMGSGPAHGSSPLMFGRMTPAMLGTLSPVQPCRSSPTGPHTFGASLSRSAVSSPTEMRVPVVSRVLSPQEWSAHNQAVAQSTFFKRQLEEQSNHFLSQEQNRALSPGHQHHIVVVRPVPAAQPVLPPTPQPKGASLDAFTPTSVLRKMHSDKVSEKGKTLAEAKEDTGLMEGIAERNLADEHLVPHDEVAQKSEPKLTGDLHDINFLDAVNPNLTTVGGHQDKQVICGQRDVLPGALSQPMSVEEKMKLSALAEKPGYLSQMLDQSAKVAAETGRRPNVARPGIDAEDLSQDNPTQRMNAPSPLVQEHTGDSQSCRAVTGAAPEAQGLSDSSPTQPDVQLNTGRVAGRAITGRSCVEHQFESGTGHSTHNLGMVRVMEQQHHFQQMHSMAQCQGMVLQPPSASAYHVPMCTQPADVSCGLMQQQQHFVGANAMNFQQNQHFSHMMAMQYPQQHCLPQPQPHVMAPSVSAQLNPYSQTSGPLSTAALRAAIERLASPAGAGKMNGPLQPTSAVHTAGGDGGHRVDLTSGIQRWFSSDILRTQLPSLPSHGIQVMTVDELERG